MARRNQNLTLSYFIKSEDKLQNTSSLKDSREINYKPSGTKLWNQNPADVQLACNYLEVERENMCL